MEHWVIDFADLCLGDIEEVGGKNASLGELIGNLSSAGVKVPGGFATTSSAFRHFLEQNQLTSSIHDALAKLDIENLSELAATGEKIRQQVMDADLPAPLVEAITSHYQALVEKHGPALSVAVRSSATAEDLPTASFAGQQETFLNIVGLENVLEAVKTVYASLYNDRAIAYRVHQDFAHEEVAISVGVQAMVRSDLGASGVMFSIDTESGYDKVVFITSSYGLGEAVVQGAVNPDEFYVHKDNVATGKPGIVRRNLGSKLEKMVYSDTQTVGKSIEMVDVPREDQLRFSLTDDEVTELARCAIAIEKHYGCPMDIEWGRDGHSGELFILQSRPETVKSQQSGQVMRRFHLTERGAVKAEGRAIGQGIGQGTARVLKHLHEMERLQPGDVLVTDMTDPDWEPIMKRASAIVTNRGGRTCHAAIIAREMGIPAVVGCGDATAKVQEGDEVTVSCAEGETGFIYSGKLNYNIQEINVGAMPEVPFKIMMNVANPDRAFAFSQVPNHGIGLARLEFIINTMIGIHPRALLEFDTLPQELQQHIGDRVAAYASPVDFYVERLAEGIATLASSFNPGPVIVRMSDFKSNEYANLLGGDLYEPHEENPMLGYRGASRYISDDFKACFALECRALRKVREEMGFTNVEVMIPFVRTVTEAKEVCAALAEHGLERGKAGLRLIMMCELPANALLAEQFLEYFDGFSIGSNDMTQLTLGLDRDSSLVAHRFDERDEAVKILLARAIKVCREKGKYIGICGQGPSDHADLAEWLVEQGIESVSLNPDTVIATWLQLAEHCK